MKLLDCDWSQILRLAPAWGRLPAECKTLFLQRSDPARPIAARAVRVDYAPLVEAGFLTFSQERGELRLPPSQQPFRRVVRALSRHAVFHPEGDERALLEDYIREHYSHDDRLALLADYGPAGDVTRPLAAQLGQPAWLRSFLEETDYREWERSYRASTRQPLLFSAETFHRAQTLLRTLMEAEDYPTPLAELAGPPAGGGSTDPGLALRALIGYGLAYPGLREPEMTLAVGVWRGVRRRLQRVAVEAPAPAQPENSLSSAFLMHDMTALLVACAQQPVRLRANDGELFAKAHREVGERLATLPDWWTRIIAYTVESRLAMARSVLEAEDLVSVEGSGSREPALAPREAGTDWLGRAEGERLRSVVHRMREDLRVDADVFYGYGFGHRPGLHCFNHLPTVRCEGEVVDLRTDVVEAFVTSAAAAPVALGAFLEYHSQERNPVLRLQQEGKPVWFSSGYRQGGDNEEELVGLWRRVLEKFLVDRLVPFGCVELGVTASGQATLVLTDVGRYLLGAAQDFDYGATEACDLVVQPNFEVVFLAPSPTAEAVVGQMAERTGRQVGSVFRITRRSIQEAHAAGMEGDAVVERLAQLSSKPVPGNVVEQIRDWSGQCRRFSVSAALLLECPDAETAVRVQSAGGGKLKRLSETVLALRDRKALKGIETKLRKAGITRQEHGV